MSKPTKAPPNAPSLWRFWRLMNDIFIHIGRTMSEAGADKAGANISEGIKFFLKTCAIGALIAVVFWQSPNILGALADFIVKVSR